MGLASDLGDDGGVGGYGGLTLNDAGEAGAGEILVYEGLACRGLVFGVESSQLGAGAGSTRGTVDLAFAGSYDVFLVGARTTLGGIKLRVGNTGDGQPGMAYLILAIGFGQEVDCQGSQIRDLVSFQLEVIFLCVHKGRETPAEGDIEMNFPAVYPDTYILLVEKRRHILDTMTLVGSPAVRVSMVVDTCE